MSNRAHLVWVKDPMNYKETSVRYEGGVGKTPRQWMAEIWGEEFEEFERPTILHINGEEIMREDWHTYVIKKDDVLVFIPLVGGFIITIIIVAVIVSVVLSLFLDIPNPNTADGQEPATVYSLDGQNNKTRLNEPVEKHYGEVRHWPSYAARYYTQAQGNQETLYALFCIGLGKYIIDEETISDTPMSSFPGVESEIYAPGEKVTLFPIDVETSSSLQNVTLYGPNQTGGPGSANEGSYTGPIGPYPTNKVGSQAYKLEYDLNFPQGLYITDKKKGTTLGLAVTVKSEYQQIDDDDNPIGGWILADQRTISMATTTPQRLTISVDIPLGRYQFRVERVNDANLVNRAQDTVQVASLRAFIDSEQNFGNVTLWAVKALASNNLNNQTRAAFNVRIRAVIPVYDPIAESWSDQPTRNPVWAMLDILRAEYGMNLPDNFVDLEFLTALAEQLDVDGITFDWTFDRRGRVWDACKTALNVANAKPLMRGPLATAARDTAEDTPIAGFNHNNILANSFKSEATFTKKFAHDGLLIEYRDPVNWTAETVPCLVDTDSGQNPKKIQLLGCTDRQRAFEWGMQTRASELWQKDNISLVTGPEGLGLTFGDLVAIKHDLLPTDLEYIDEQTGSVSTDSINVLASSTVITLPKTPQVTTQNDYYISLRKKDGVIGGPFLITDISENVVTISETLNLTDYQVSANSEDPTYFFGSNSNIFQLGKVISVRARENFETELKVVNYEPRMYQFKGIIAPELNRPAVPVLPPELPVITNLSAITNPDNLSEVFISWDVADGATDYVVEISVDGGNTYFSQARVNIPSYTYISEPITLFVRVYGVNVGAGLPVVWSGQVGLAEFEPPTVDDLSVSSPFEESQLDLTWGLLPTATSYELIIKQGGNTLRTVEVTGNSYSYLASIAKQDAQLAGAVLSRALTVEIVSRNSIGDSAATSSVFTNPGPTVLSTPSAAFVSASGTLRTYRFSALAGSNFDLDIVEVHASQTDGFTEGPANLVASYNATQNTTGYIDAEMDVGTGPQTIYFKIAAKDVWGEERTYTPQQTFTG